MAPFDESNGGAPSPKLPGKPCDPWMALKTQRGFGNEHETEALRVVLAAHVSRSGRRIGGRLGSHGRLWRF